jgi:hypothetical protein
MGVVHIVKMPEGGLPRMSLLAKEQGALLTEAMLEASLGRSACLARAACQYGANHRETAADTTPMAGRQNTIEDGIAIFMVSYEF